MPQHVLTTQQTLRVLRIVHAALLVAILLYAWIPEVIQLPATRSVDRNMYDGLAGVALLSVAIALVVRSRMLNPAVEAFRANPADSQAHQRWRVAGLLSDALALSVVLYGLVLLLTGATRAQARAILHRRFPSHDDLVAASPVDEILAGSHPEMEDPDAAQNFP